MARTESSEKALLSEARPSASAEVWADVKTSVMVLFASSELSLIQRMFKENSPRSLPLTVTTVVPPVPMGLVLVPDVSIAVITTVNLDCVICVKALVSVAGKVVLEFLVSASEMVLARIKFLSKVWVLRV